MIERELATQRIIETVRESEREENRTCLKCKILPLKFAEILSEY